MATQVLPKEIRQARAFLLSRQIGPNQVPPKLFAMTAKRMNKNFTELLQFLSVLKMQGQGQGQSPQADQFIEDSGSL